MAYEMLVGLKIKDAEVYQKYREAMYPILEQFGGGFGYDFWIQETLRSKTPNPINRVFTIYFESKQSMDLFFSDPKYLEAKKRFFEESVEATTIISQYQT